MHDNRSQRERATELLSGSSTNLNESVRFPTSNNKIIITSSGNYSHLRRRSILSLIKCNDNEGEREAQEEGDDDRGCTHVCVTDRWSSAINTPASSFAANFINWMLATLLMIALLERARPPSLRSRRRRRRLANCYAPPVYHTPYHLSERRR